MTPTECFKSAARIEKLADYCFWTITASSSLLLVLPDKRVEFIVEPILIVVAVLALACSYFGVASQNMGNRLLRESQLSDALCATLESPQRADYYNNPLGPSIKRLAATTLENTMFTAKVLRLMLKKERVANTLYLSILLICLIVRETSLNWLVYLTQILFSADVVLHWLRSERYRSRALQVHEKLRQFFLQGGDVETANGTAIVLAAFADYECAKDEAALPLDSKLFDRINPEQSVEWERLKAMLAIR